MIDETVQQTQTTEITSLINSSTPLELFSFEHEAKTFEEYTGQVEDIHVLIVSKLLNLVFFLVRRSVDHVEKFKTRRIWKSDYAENPSIFGKFNSSTKRMDFWCEIKIIRNEIPRWNSLLIDLPFTDWNLLEMAITLMNNYKEKGYLLRRIVFVHSILLYNSMSNFTDHEFDKEGSLRKVCFSQSIEKYESIVLAICWCWFYWISLWYSQRSNVFGIIEEILSNWESWRNYAKWWFQ